MTVTRQIAMHELEALYNSGSMPSMPSPSLEEGGMLGIVTKFDFLRAFAFTDRFFSRTPERSERA